MVKAILVMIMVAYAIFTMILFPYLLMRCIQYKRFVDEDIRPFFDRWAKDFKEMNQEHKKQSQRVNSELDKYRQRPKRKPLF